MRTETFNTPYGWVSRNEALRALIAAIYDTAKERQEFTTDDVYQRVRSFVAADVLRKAVANSKLISVALTKARKKGMCSPAAGISAQGDQVCHKRFKRVWRSNIANAA